VADFCRRTQNFKAAYCSSRTDSISHMRLPTTRAFTAHCCWLRAHPTRAGLHTTTCFITICSLRATK
jgi:hypothetical protein